MEKVKSMLITLSKKQKEIETIIFLMNLVILAIILLFHLNEVWLIILSAIAILGVLLAFTAETVGKYSESVVRKNKLIHILLSDTSVVLILLAITYVFMIALLNLIPSISWYVIGIICIASVIIVTIKTYLITNYFENKIIK